QVSKGALQLNMGTLYPALMRLEQRGLLDARWGTTDNNRRARFYELTRAGRRELAREKEDWDRMTAIMQARLRGEAEAGARAARIHRPSRRNAAAAPQRRRPRRGTAQSSRLCRGRGATARRTGATWAAARRQSRVRVRGGSRSEPSRLARRHPPRHRLCL